MRGRPGGEGATALEALAEWIDEDLARTATASAAPPPRN